MTFNDLFLKRMNEILAQYQGKKALIFFEGFTSAQNKLLLTRPDSLLDPGTTLQGEFLNIPQIASNAARQQMLKKILLSDNRMLTGVYEQFIAISQSVQELYDGEIVIVVNNLFNQYYPSAISPIFEKELYSYVQHEDQDVPELLQSYIDVYGDARFLGGEKYFLVPINRHTDEKYRTIPFFRTDSLQECIPKEIKSKSCISISDSDFQIHMAEILGGKEYVPVTYVVDADNRKTYENLQIWIRVLGKLGLTYGIQIHSRFEKIDNSDDNKYLPLLQKYWGQDSEFRKLNFYKEPLTSNETTQISQGHIISTIIAQSEKALNGNHEFNNVFITAPTGAGKSLLFQIPAIHLAKEYNAVTIVVTPLIALMADQVNKLQTGYHITLATFINSTITYDEREKRIGAVKRGEKSIVYLAPEMLVSGAIENLIGERPLGLFVVDEAHTITSWGKDFRADYWYLGDFLAALRRNSAQKGADADKKARLFPVLCLTATAVYGGPEDVVNETIESLNLDNPILYLGDVRRNNIRFQIHHIDRSIIEGGIEEYKVNKAADRIKEFVTNDQKALVYCPFVTQTESIYTALEPEIQKKVALYNGSINKNARAIAQKRFENDECSVMICTKAFGMGIDIKNIQYIYHYAPSGNLADYVQEIGRAARSPEIEGTAMTDYLNSDIRYVRTLYGLSEMKQYQLKEMLRKIYDIYSAKHHRNLLVSPDAFTYLFEENSLKNKVKCGLLLIAKDMVGKYGIPIITVRPKSMLTNNYVNVPHTVEKIFLDKYGKYTKLLQDKTKRVIQSPSGSHNPQVVIYNSGNIYGVDMAHLWEDYFSELSFMQFKHKFFDGTLFNLGEDEILSPRIRVIIHYADSFENTVEKLKTYLTKISDIFKKYKTERRTFTSEDFRKDLISVFDVKIKQYGFSDMLLNLFVADISQNIAFNINSDKLHFIVSKKSATGDNLVYRVMNYNYITMADTYLQLLRPCIPYDGKTYESFVAVHKGESNKRRINLLSILELFELASYEISGGQNLEIFIRINDPIKIRRLAFGNYTNALLTDLRKRHRVSQDIITKFFRNQFTDEERWNIIENYFLGREDYVNQLLSENDRATVQ